MADYYYPGNSVTPTEKERKEAEENYKEELRQRALRKEIEENSRKVCEALEKDRERRGG